MRTLVDRLWAWTAMPVLSLVPSSGRLVVGAMVTGVAARSPCVVGPSLSLMPGAGGRLPDLGLAPPVVGISLYPCRRPLQLVVGTAWLVPGKVGPLRLAMILQAVAPTSLHCLLQVVPVLLVAVLEAVVPVVLVQRTTLVLCLVKAVWLGWGRQG